MREILARFCDGMSWPLARPFRVSSNFVQRLQPAHQPRHNLSLLRQTLTHAEPRPIQAVAEPTPLVTASASAHVPGESVTITCQVANISQMFGDSVFTLVWFQRPYLWDVSNAEQLLEDLLDTLGNERNVENMPTYPLGTIHLCYTGGARHKSESTTKCIVDGQQRVLTLCLLLAALRLRLLESSDDNHIHMAKHIGEKMLYTEGDVLLRRKPQLRVQLLEDKDTDFFQKLLFPAGYVDVSSSSARRPRPHLEGESQPSLWQNMELFNSRLKDLTPEHCGALASFICHFVVVILTDSNDLSLSLRLFHTSAQRGQDMMPIDLLKALVFEGLSNESQAVMGQKWSNLERDKGREIMNEAMCAVLPLHTSSRKLSAFGSSSGGFDEVQDLFLAIKSRHVNDGQHPGETFFTNFLEPYVRMYAWIANDTSPNLLMGSEYQQQLEKQLRYLRRININMEWKPVAIGILMGYISAAWSPQRCINLLSDLERVCMCAWLCKWSPKQRRQRFMKAIAEMGYSRGMEWPLSLQILEEELPALMLSKEESRDMVDALKEDMTPGKAKVILLRFNEHILRIHDKSYMAYVEDGRLQVEHVLPQTLPSTGAWGQFSEEDHAYWVKKLANLMLLSGKRNARGGNKGFEEKKALYQASNRVHVGEQAIPLSDKILRKEKWDVAELQDMQNEHVKLCRQCWRLYD